VSRTGPNSTSTRNTTTSVRSSGSANSSQQQKPCLTTNNTNKNYLKVTVLNNNAEHGQLLAQQVLAKRSIEQSRPPRRFLKHDQQQEQGDASSTNRKSKSMITFKDLTTSSIDSSDWLIFFDFNQRMVFYNYCVYIFTYIDHYILYFARYIIKKWWTSQKTKLICYIFENHVPNIWC